MLVLFEVGSSRSYKIDYSAREWQSRICRSFRNFGKGPHAPAPSIPGRVGTHRFAPRSVCYRFLGIIAATLWQRGTSLPRYASLERIQSARTAKCAEDAPVLLNPIGRLPQLIQHACFESR